MHSLHSRWRQLCQSSLFGWKLTRVAPILPLHGPQFSALERVQTTDWTNATSFTDYETGPPGLILTSPTPSPVHGPASALSSAGQLRGRQNPRPRPQWLLGPFRSVNVSPLRLCLLSACIGMSFPFSVAQLCPNATAFARNQVNRLGLTGSDLPAFNSSLSVCWHLRYSWFFFFFRFFFFFFFCHIWLLKLVNSFYQSSLVNIWPVIIEK